jgi:hypothetical protein
MFTVVALIVFLGFTATVLPAQSEEARIRSGESSPDMSLFITVEQLYEIAESYGEEGRRAYVEARFTFDIVWPVVYTLFLASSISWLYSRSLSSNSTLQLANMVPVVGMILDFLENISASIVMLRFPDRTPVIDIAATMFTAMKWLFVGGSFLVLLGGLVKYGVKRMRQVTSSTGPASN